MRSGCRNYGSLPNADSQQTRVIKYRRGRKLYRWRIDSRGDRKTARVPTRDGRKRSAFSELLESIGTISRHNQGRYGKGQCRSEEFGKMGSNRSRPQQAKVIGKRLIACNRRATWCEMRKQKRLLQ